MTTYCGYTKTTTGRPCDQTVDPGATECRVGHPYTGSNGGVSSAQKSGVKQAADAAFTKSSTEIEVMDTGLFVHTERSRRTQIAREHLTEAFYKKQVFPGEQESVQGAIEITVEKIDEVRGQLNGTNADVDEFEAQVAKRISEGYYNDYDGIQTKFWTEEDVVEEFDSWRNDREARSLDVPSEHPLYRETVHLMWKTNHVDDAEYDTASAESAVHAVLTGDDTYSGISELASELRAENEHLAR